MEEVREGTHENMETTKKVKYNLACGLDYREGYINVDDGSMLGTKFDIKENLFDFRIPKNSADEIFLSHFMMYLLPEQALRLFERWYFGLKKDGQFIIETSDAKKLARIIAHSMKPSEINSAITQFYGAGATRGHTWIWSEETMVPLLKYVGFNKMKKIDGGSHKRLDRDITIVATK